MNNWALQDNEKDHKVVIFRDSLQNIGLEKRVYKGNQVEFGLIYNNLGKMLGYQMKYGYSKKFPKLVLFNAFMICYNPRKQVLVKEEQLEVLYEDQIVRFLAMTHKSGVRDYLLIGRWRVESEVAAEEEVETEGVE